MNNQIKNKEEQKCCPQDCFCDFCGNYHQHRFWCSNYNKTCEYISKEKFNKMKRIYEQIHKLTLELKQLKKQK